MAWFTFSDASGETFVLEIRELDLIGHSRALLSGSDSADPHVAGTVVKTAAAYNVGWSYHIDPRSIFFFEFAAEVGDSTMRYIEDHLAEVGGALLPGSRWTGWSSKLTGELRPQFGTGSDDMLAGTADNDLILGRVGDDRLAGSRGDDHLAGGHGRDLVSGKRGDDKLGGGIGDDFLSGGIGEDVIVGGPGNDRLEGGPGNDTFLFGPPAHSGHDTLSSFDGGTGAGDVIRLDRGWSAGLTDRTGDGTIDAADIALSFLRSGLDLELVTGRGTITLKGMAGHSLATDDFLIA